jgi:predicted acylesterase/phospholipase RssA
MARVGVLECFEEHHIPIDFIVGTSTGGLVAGAYASGMSPDEINTLLKDADWDLMFLSDSPYKYKTFRRKEDKREFPSLLDFSLAAARVPGRRPLLRRARTALSLSCHCFRPKFLLDRNA